MKKFRISLLAATLASLFVSNTSFAAAFQLYELGTPIIGTAGVGQAVVADDASVAYFNPASMMSLKRTQYMLGAQTLFPNIHFYKNSSNTIAGDNGGNAATPVPGMDIYYVYDVAPQVKAGVSFTAPYGGMLTYDDGWVGRYNVQNTEFYTLNLSPSVAYQINRWLAFAVGGVYEYANLQQTVALPIPGEPLIDGQLNLKASSFAPGYNFGFVLTPSEKTRIGFAFRSQIIHHLGGNSTFLRLPFTPNTTTKLVVPNNFIISASQDIGSKFKLLVEAGWAQWSAMQATVITISGYNATTVLNWNNTWRAGFAGQYMVTPDLTVQAGASYDSSPTTSTRRLPDLPMDKQIRAGLGLQYSVMKMAKLGFSYEYINFGKARINNTSSTGVLSGSYPRNFASVVQASINVAC